MASHDANHIAISTNLVCTTGAFIGETASWTIRVAPTAAGLNAGYTTLPVFNTNDVASASTTTLNGRSYNETRAWDPGMWQGDPTKSVTWADLYQALNAVEAFWNAVRGESVTSYTLQSFKAICPGPDGKAHTASTTWTPAVASAGTQASALCPEIALVISFYSANTAKTGRGRMYFGPLGISGTTGDGLFTTTRLNTFGAKTQDMLNAFHAITPSGGVPGYRGVIWSRLDKTKGSIIQRVRVGDEPDHHETRTKQRPEAYTSFPLVP